MLDVVAQDIKENALETLNEGDSPNSKLICETLNEVPWAVDAEQHAHYVECSVSEYKVCPAPKFAP